ncbi:hypothetical protein BP6252_13213 [Coleophoma cylindrospora]|uniref:Heterokaryon incompatibility domain-containing protein n=1 Tax=Coleophoma cylindrospora TaxID=1849047 RepID=A0A3D8QAM9_9HELO|nr:hypothetical protein BP6252_13213 [Coleophoma cylindrospora]
MDHCPLPYNFVHPPVKVKCFSIDEYPYGEVDFLEYPASRGWKHSDLNGYSQIHHGIETTISSMAPQPGPVRTPTERNPTFQTWAFFGLMSEVFQKQVTRASFISVGEDGQEYIDTSVFPKLVRDFIFQVRAQSDGGPEEQEAKSWKCIDVVLSCLQQMKDLISGVQARDGVAPEILDEALALSLEILLNDLLPAMTQAYETIIPQELSEYLDKEGIVLEGDSPAQNPTEVPFLSLYFQRRLKEDGWCTTEIERIYHSMPSPPSRYYISMLDRPQPELSHKDCTSSSCIYWGMKETKYITKHTTDDCACEDVAMPQVDVEAILEHGSYPLIVPDLTNAGPDGKLYVKMVPSSPERKYVAISHVWADGMGNPGANMIPLCLFKHLSKMVREAFGAASDVYFWFDTLCFPLKPDEAYKKAMEAMRDTYEHADLVLVIESYLMSQDFAPITEDEACLRILCSRWSGRLWTF